MEKMNETPNQALVDDVAKKLHEIIKKPEWADYVKTGTMKERPPVSADWYYKRAASVLLKVLKRGPIGVSKMRTIYGGLKRRGHQPAEFRRASGFVLRKILQSLEKAELIKNINTGTHKGRKITPKGISFIAKKK